MPREPARHPHRRPLVMAVTVLLTGVAAPLLAAPDCPDPAEWRRPTQMQLRERLTPLQYRVTQQDATEPPFENAYWDHQAEGIYVDVVSGEPLFSSLDRFKSGTGWPSFHSPLEPALIVEHADHSLGLRRTEVRSRHGDSHLGHVFDDGPAPSGLRYCINSAALRFIPVADLEKDGYGAYRALFADGADGSAMRGRCAGR